MTERVTSDEDEFYDANEYLSEDAKSMDEQYGSLNDLGLEDIEMNLPDAEKAELELDGDLDELRRAVKLFLNGSFHEAEQVLKVKYKKSLYITHGYATLMFIKSLMTFEPVDIGNTLELIKTAVIVAHNYRKKDYSLLQSVTNFVKGLSLTNMTRLQRHAELIYAESYLLKAVLTIIHDESLFSFVREGINIRSSYQTYQQCNRWLQKHEKQPQLTKQSSYTLFKKQRSEVDSIDASGSGSKEIADADFVSGVKFGLGIFNVMLSMLPSRFLKVIEIMGFSSSRKAGLAMLSDPDIDKGLRRFLCDLFLLTYHGVISSYVTFIEPDFELMDRILKRDLELYPNGPLHLFFAGRARHSRGNLEQAIPFYQKSIDSQREWIQLHHICYWDMSLCLAGLFRFTEAADCIETLRKDSRWSKAIYHYIIGMYLYMAKQLGQEDVNQSKIDEMFQAVPTLLQRIAGKRIPLEKFVARKSRKYFMQNKRLWFPAFEFFMFWSTFRLMNTELPRVLELVDASLVHLDDQKSKSYPELPYETFYDDYCLAWLIKGCCLRELDKLDDSIASFNHVFAHEKSIALDHYVVPYAHYEMARAYLKFNPPNTEEARICFETARTNYKKFSLENSLHFRVHNGLHKVDELENRQQAFADVDEGE